MAAGEDGGRARRSELTREPVMGIFSWFRSRRSADDEAEAETETDQPHSLIRLRYDDPADDEMHRAAAADVAAVEEDDKYFGRNAPADQDEL